MDGDMSRQNTAHVAVGEMIQPDRWIALSGVECNIPDPDKLTHIQFRRFAGCPICNTHLHEVTTRRAELIAAGVHEVIVFHSTASELLKYQPDLPFDVIADPHKALYRRFGVERSPRALLNPRIWPRMYTIMRTALRMMRTGRKLQLRPTGGELGLPADFLIDSQGEVVAVKYGQHSYDQWPVDEVLRLAQRVGGKS